ncbi:hypothetical protein [Pseudolysinimonas kribbensis]|uniref:hypothetical protein n=1 Tax=Pseudolysinimonas kribbensis TaxID=433641 RepID=UPI0024E0D12E|nr:hypothetical protein [Pseudolysinimonas kribbensis]
MLLAVLHALVAVTAGAGGGALMLGGLRPDLAGPLVPPVSYLDGSLFTSYLVPGILLLGVIGGTHIVAFVAQLRRTPHAPVWSTAAAFGTLIWIFVQMIYVPFSFLQAAYFAVGIAECGLVLLTLGVLRPHGERTARRGA